MFVIVTLMNFFFKKLRNEALNGGITNSLPDEMTPRVGHSFDSARAG